MKLPFHITGIESYYGGKGGTGTPQAIINNIPNFSAYCELFLGGGSIFRHIHFEPDDAIWLNELNYPVFNQWKQAKLNGEIPYQSLGITNEDAFEIIKALAYSRQMVFNPQTGKYIPSSDTFVFLDPPYVINSRKTPRLVYDCELTDEQHEEFIGLIRAMPQKVMVTHYPHPIYDEGLKDWRVQKFYSATRGGFVIEHMYMNYDEPNELKDYYYLGNDFRERELIRNKIKRAVAKMERLPLYERQAIFKALSKQMNLSEEISESIEILADGSPETVSY